MLIVLSEQNEVVQFSVNAESVLGFQPVLGASLDSRLVSLLDRRTDSLGGRATGLGVLDVPGGQADVLAHRVGPCTVLEIEPFDPDDDGRSEADVQDLVLDTMASLQGATTIDSAVQTVATAVRTLTRFDRVWVYRFEADGHGVIVAEDRESWIPPFLGLHYPAIDIPQQARALYQENRARFIVDAKAEPSALSPEVNPLLEGRLDQSACVLRAVSPYHIEYLANMGVRASMSLAIIVEGELWGLISAHHYRSPRRLSRRTRHAAELLASVTSHQLAAQEALELATARVLLRDAQQRLLEGLVEGDGIARSLASDALLDVVPAGGAAVQIGEEFHTVGAAPEAAVVRRIVDAVGRRREDGVVAVTRLSELDEELGEDPEVLATAAGVLAAPLSVRQKNYVLWFRPEWQREVVWGRSAAPVMVEENGRLRLAERESYEAWTETVRGQCRPWRALDQDAASQLLGAVAAVVLDRAAEMSRLNDQLARTNAELDAFGYGAARDLKEPLRSIHSLVSFVQDDEQDTMSRHGRAQLDAMVQLVERMAVLVDSLYEFSRVGREPVELETIDLAELSADVVLMSRSVLVRSHISPVLPAAGTCSFIGDRVLLGQVLGHVIDNAVKFAGPAETRIEIGCCELADTERGPSVVEVAVHAENPPVVIYVRDNGIGIEPDRHEEVFAMLRRLNEPTSYDGGIGAGLTISRRIVERLDGRIWVESGGAGTGTTIYLALPGVP